MRRPATVLLGTLLVGCGTGPEQEEEGRNDGVEVSLSAALISPKATWASGTYLDNTPSLAFDQDPATSWNSGGYPTQWIGVDLGAPYDLVSVRLLVKQVPAGATIHYVYGSPDDTHYSLLGGFSRTTSNSQAPA